MILYPLIYTICTAPLATARIVALAGHDVPLSYFVMAGTMIACNGWLDVLLYASTRADIVFSEYPPGEETGLETFAFMGKGHRLGTVTTIQAGNVGERTGSRLGGRMRRNGSRGGSLRGRDDSVENLYGLDRIGIKGEVTISVDVAGENEMRSGTGTRQGSIGAGNGWDARSVRSVRSAKSGKSFET
ncbi:hypothetical protein EG329_009531 [Mollisiaceae sp. DMI_Dod_QoI]|nr:hypothetical protein EG329_009531 [Helotiales sp. DMI_Dod_QoI]